MKKNILYLFLVILISVFSLNIVSAGVTVSVDSYYPTPSEAGDYFNIILKITNTGESATNAVIKFKDSYPFSLDPGEEKEITINMP